MTQPASKPQAPVAVIGAVEQAATLLSRDRMKLVSELCEPDSASGLARRTGWPRQRINYHLRELEKQGLVELVEERRRGNCTERVLRASARSYLISPDVLAGLGATPDVVQDRFSSAYLVAVAAEIIREVAGLRKRAVEAGRKLATLTLQTEICFESPREQRAFSEELAGQVGRLAAKYQSSQGRRFRLAAGVYPAPPEEKERNP